MARATVDEVKNLVEPPQALLDGLRLESLELHAQAQFSTGTRIDGVETLLRAVGHNGAQVPPPIVVAAAKALGLGPSLAIWTFQEAAMMAQAFRAEGLSIKVRVNVMEPEMVHAPTLDALAAIVRLEPDLEVELVEGDRSDDLDAVIRAMDVLIDAGARLWLDDFTGLKSDLDRLVGKAAGRITGLKLDKCYLDLAREQGPEDVRAVFDHFDPLMDDVLLEGVEDWSDLDLARQAGISMLQGHHLHRAEKLSKALPFFARHEQWRKAELTRISA